MREGCQGFAEPNLSTLLYKSKSLRTEDLKYRTNVKVFFNNGIIPDKGGKEVSYLTVLTPYIHDRNHFLNIMGKKNEIKNPVNIAVNHVPCNRGAARSSKGDYRTASAIPQPEGSF
jgi:hypothetical protein